MKINGFSCIASASQWPFTAGPIIVPLFQPMLSIVKEENGLTAIQLLEVCAILPKVKSEFSASKGWLLRQALGPLMIQSHSQLLQTTNPTHSVELSMCHRFTSNFEMKTTVRKAVTHYCANLGIAPFRNHSQWVLLLAMSHPVTDWGNSQEYHIDL